MERKTDKREQELADALLAYQRGEAEAESRLVELVYRQMRVLARNILSKRAIPRAIVDEDELVQNAMFRVWTYLRAGKFRGEAKLSTFVARVLYNTLVDAHRSMANESRFTLSKTEPLDPVVEEKITEVVGLHEALDALRKRSPVVAEIIELRHIMELPSRDIASTLKMSEGQVKKRAQQGMRFLADQLKSLPAPETLRAVVDRASVFSQQDWSKKGFEVRFAPELSGAEVEAVLTALGDYFRACGGAGLRVDFGFEEAKAREPIHA